MAQSPAHRFGQIIGDLLEAAVEPPLRNLANAYGLYLDKRGPRPARDGRKVSWVDEYGNSHDLDFVLERGGNAGKIGEPVAFIESAWRRYTKHSRNKAQEIQGAIVPLVARHHRLAPMMGVILAGVFTEGALAQLRSTGFKVLYIPYAEIVKAFKAAGIDAAFDEETPDTDFVVKVRAWDALPPRERLMVTTKLVDANADRFREFINAVEVTVTRRILAIHVLPLHGTAIVLSSVDEAVRFIKGYVPRGALPPIIKYEIIVRFSNGDEIRASFADSVSAVAFLNTQKRPELSPNM